MDSWALYQKTVFVVGEGVLPQALPEMFGIVTAWNPAGAIASDAENDRADRQLFAALEEAGKDPVRITGCSPDRSHAEAGWLFSCERETAILWGRRFRQKAVYWVTGDRLWLIACDRSERPCGLGSFRARIVAPLE